MQKNPYKTFENYILRTPLFPLNTYTNLTNKNSISNEKLEALISSPEFREAVYLASPSLTSLIDQRVNGLIKDKKKEKKLKATILKYIARMSSRCTPFGLFATVSVGSFSSSTNIELKDKLEHKRSTRFDMTLLDSLCRSLSEKTDIKNALKFYTNNSLYLLNKQYRYVSYTLNKNRRIYHLEGVTHTPYLETVIKEAKNGKKIDELTSIIGVDGVTKIEAKEYIDTLIENRILISELEPTITGNNSFDKIIELLECRLLKDDVIVNTLNEYKEDLNTIDKSFINGIKTYKNLEEKVKAFDVPVNEKAFIQIDSISSTKVNVLDISVEKQLKEAMVILNKMSFPFEIERMAIFKRQFKKRFEEEEVSISFALDAEVGLGYDVKKNDFNPMLDNLTLPAIRKHYKRFIWTDVDEFLFKKVISALKDNTKIIELTNNDFKDYKEEWTDLPDTISALVEVVNSGNKTRIFCDGIGGFSAANLISRFSHLDKSIYEYEKEILNIEQQINSDKVIAEIVHLPQSKTGNVIHRSVQRAYEIPYLGKSSLPKERQIDVNDIMISIKGSNIVLRSKKMNRQILPRLTNAHALNSESLPIYRFLYDVQRQNKREGVSFSWHELFNNFSFLPRVIHKNVVFSKAKWRIDTIEMASFYEYKDDKILRDLFIKWCNKIELPQYVQLIEGDNALLVNTNNIDCINMLLYTIKNKTSFLLEEFLFSSDNTVTNNKSSFCNQFVISFFNDKKLKASRVNDN